jgi:hypothetical protein
VIAIQAAVVVAVQVQSRLVAIASVPDIPSAGAASAIPFSTTTSHLTAVGDVTEMDEEVPVHALERKHNAQIANTPARIGAPCMLQAVCLRWGSAEIARVAGPSGLFPGSGSTRRLY